MTSIIFPGQGSQFVGMIRDFYDNYQIVKQTIEKISDYSGINIKEIIFEDKNNFLDLTQYTQLSLFSASYCIFEVLKKEKPNFINSINSMLGHSLGEYTALACSDKLSLEDTCKILKKRGELMGNAVPSKKSGMAALIGCDSNTIEKIINENNINLEIANDNSPIQIVVSGAIDDLKDSKNVFLDNKVKRFVILKVSAAFHSKYMVKAEEELNNHINILNFNQNSIKIISNSTSKISNDSKLIKESIKKQMSNRVRWTESIKELENTGEKKIIEIGPGSVLSGLIKRISNNFDIKTVSNMGDLETL